MNTAPLPPSTNAEAQKSSISINGTLYQVSVVHEPSVTTGEDDD